MDRSLFDQIWIAQDAFRSDPAYRPLLQEYALRNDELLHQLETMTPRQQDAVLDFCGILVELHLKMLEYAAHCSM